MKKLMCVVALMLGVSMATFGTDKSVANTNAMNANYSINVNAKSLVRYLDLSVEQEPLVIEFQRAFEKSLIDASEIQTLPVREAIVKNAVKINLRNMNCVLDKKQYRKYTRVLNVSLRNRRIVK